MVWLVLDGWAPRTVVCGADPASPRGRTGGGKASPQSPGGPLEGGAIRVLDDGGSRWGAERRNGTPAARPVRKATGLQETAGSPKARRSAAVPRRNSSPGD